MLAASCLAGSCFDKRRANSMTFTTAHCTQLACISAIPGTSDASIGDPAMHCRVAQRLLLPLELVMFPFIKTVFIKSGCQHISSMGGLLNSSKTWPLLLHGVAFPHSYAAM